MIFRPKPGQRVRLHYRKGDPRLVAKLHGCRGTVRRVAAGPGPINAEVLLDPGTWGICVTVPRGNLVKICDRVTPAPETEACEKAEPVEETSA